MKTKSFRSLLFVLSLLCVAVFAVLFSATEIGFAVSEAKSPSLSSSNLLSEMTDRESVEFIVDNGIKIPDELAIEPDFGSYVKILIETVEANPYYTPAVSWDVAHNFVESVKELVNNHYSRVEERSSQSPSPTRYTLSDNWVQNSSGQWVSSGGAWNSSWINYNCYAYGIQRTEYPPQYSTGFQYQPGDFAGTGVFTNSISIYNLALIVKDDLEFLGNTVSVSLNQPTSLGTDEQLIAIRRTNNSPHDYHFMRYNQADGWWYHKPGNTAILRYKHHPSAQNWSNEYSWYGTEDSGSIVYNSAVYYITFSQNPFTTSLSNGNITITGVKQGTILTGNVTIPSSMVINGTSYPVTAIAPSAFANQTSRIPITIPSTVTSIGDGNLIRATDNGEVSTMAGGAPVRVSAWDNVPTAPYINVTRAFVDNLPKYPLDGTTVHDHLGHVFIFAGGAPIHVDNWANIGGSRPFIRVDGVALRTHDETGPFKHVRAHPADGTVVRVLSGSAFSFLGGVALPLIGSAPNATLVDFASIPHYTVSQVSASLRTASITGITNLPRVPVAPLSEISIPVVIYHNGQLHVVTEIGNSAFANQPQLSQITIPSSVTGIGVNAFNGTNLSVIKKSSSMVHSTGGLGTSFSNWQTLEILPSVNYSALYGMGRRTLDVTYSADFAVFGTVEYQFRLVDVANNVVHSTASIVAPNNGQDHTRIEVFNTVMLANIANNSNLQIQIKYRKTQVLWGGHFTVSGNSLTMNFSN
ncbi:MAG: leucine-rich repeat domain-containing protein [Firmicutes bacterium]|nr:leucine-rich repeat domain-containing protein [Bacillota bacterium]